jgi:hypothetical protein
VSTGLRPVVPVGPIRRSGRVRPRQAPPAEPEAPEIAPVEPVPPARRHHRTAQRRPGWPAAWPVTAFLLLYPIWWALGLADYLPIILMVPMALRMYAWRSAGRRVMLPSGFILWLLFLLCTLASVATISLTAPDTVVSSVSNRALSYGDRTLVYVGLTVLLIYAGNLTEQELPRRRLAWLLGLVAVYAIIGGTAGLAFPHLRFSSPLLYALPHSFRSNLVISSAMHPGLTQTQSIVAAGGGRPKAPFDFTNTWGNSLTLLIPFLIAGWWPGRSRRQRIITAVVLAVAIAPIIYSLNRGMWLGLGASGAYISLRMAARGKLAPLGGMIAAVGLIGVLLAASPLSTVVSQRLANGQSDTIRTGLTSMAIKDAKSSPILGYGDTRREVGSPTSIAVGPTPNCPACGQAPVGSNGQLWLLLICVSYPGTAFYLGFFAYSIWRYRRDRTPIGLAGVLVLLLTFLFMNTYVAVGPPLTFTMLTVALLWRNDQERQANPPGPAGRPRLRRAISRSRVASDGEQAAA